MSHWRHTWHVQGVPLVLPWLGLPFAPPPSPLLRGLRHITLGVGVILDCGFFSFQFLLSVWLQGPLRKPLSPPGQEPWGC